jgi:hypothetical protein
MFTSIEGNNCLIYIAIYCYLEFNLFQRDDNEVRLVQDRHAYLNFYSASSLKKQSASGSVAKLGHVILIPSQTFFAVSP